MFERGIANILRTWFPVNGLEQPAAERYVRVDTFQRYCATQLAGAGHVVPMRLGVCVLCLATATAVILTAIPTAEVGHDMAKSIDGGTRKCQDVTKNISENILTGVINRLRKVSYPPSKLPLSLIPSSPGILG